MHLHKHPRTFIAQDRFLPLHQTQTLGDANAGNKAISTCVSS